MTKPKELDELTDEAAIRRLFPAEVVKEAKRVAREADERKGRPKREPKKAAKSKASG